MKDAAGVCNVAKILENVGYTNTLIVISAMGKTTNALEVVVNSYFKEQEKLAESIQVIKDFHYHIIRELFTDENHPVYWKVDGLFAELTSFLERNKSPQTIAAASILAKTYRDAYMSDLALQFPEYHWQQNKGYPTPEHRRAIAEYGATPHHRKTFQLLPVEQLSLF